MSDFDDEIRSRGSIEFVESSILDTVVPLASSLDIEEVLSGSVERLDEGNDSPLASIPQRHALFFDETIDIYIILQTPCFDERTLRSYLGRLVITVEAQVINVSLASPENRPIPGQEVIYNGSIQDSDDPLIIVQGPDETERDSGDGHILAVWKLSAFLIRPRLRLQNPSIIISAIASLKPSEQMDPESLEQEYLPSQIPSGINLLESFMDDPALGGIRPRLSAMRVSRVAPATQLSRDLIRPLKNISRQTIKCYPAINARVRYSRPNGTPNYQTVIASLDVDITPFANCEITLDKVRLVIVGGKVDDLNDVHGVHLPLSCFPQDDVTFIYRLEPYDLDVTNKSLVRALEISIEATANLSATCQPRLEMRWTTSIDFTSPVNAGFGNATQPIQRSHRPAQLPIGNSTFDGVPTVASLAAIKPDALPSVDVTTRQARNLSVPDFGVTVTFTSSDPDTPIRPGVPFTWSVFIVNRSDRPRKLALVVISKRRRTEARITRPPSAGFGGPRPDHKVADAVVDENIIYAMQRNSSLDSTEIVCLSTNTRVGPLAPSACYEVELKFMALKAGVVEVEAVRVIDLGTQEHVDIKDLPTILVAPECRP
ncbi:TRAPP trafficking subunit Trs65-domain-containing protein [Calycina marina]|uniref:TRAPP trafficking subunit Trs65-domain-containing protein n=1 Tax=Calycina marina TaxID=1763456 RepID=A0A9P7Z9P6_9HELO|nr:TRAPP trafficking subunit Trs65-domain-containing protein [Calycina marina]